MAIIRLTGQILHRYRSLRKPNGQVAAKRGAVNDNVVEEAMAKVEEAINQVIEQGGVVHEDSLFTGRGAGGGRNGHFPMICEHVDKTLQAHAEEPHSR